jgi:ureidoglycolate dehydrogenase (NAD+)
MSESRDETFGGRKHRQNAAMLAIDVTAFGDLDAFRSAVDAAVGAIKALPAAGENAEILLPGERGARTFGQRTREGIPIPAKTWEALVEAVQAVGATVDG